MKEIKVQVLNHTNVVLHAGSVGLVVVLWLALGQEMVANNQWHGAICKREDLMLNLVRFSGSHIQVSLLWWKVNVFHRTSSSEGLIHESFDWVLDRCERLLARVVSLINTCLL